MVNRIAFVYSDSPLTSFSYSDETANQKAFITVELFKPTLSKDEIQGVLLNGRKYAHLKYKYDVYTVTISSDELDSDAITFFRNFWTANNKYIATNLVDGNYIEVITDSGDLPITYLDNLEILPELTLKLSTINPI